MASLRMRWAQNGGYLQGRSFPGHTNKKHYFLTDQTPLPKMTQRLRLSVVSKLVGQSTNISSNSFNLNTLIRSDQNPTGDDRTAANNVVWSKKKTVDKEEENDYSEKLDQWMRDSVVEIVSNIGKAPLLLHIYSDDERKEESSSSSSSKSSTSMGLVIERAVAERWPSIKGRWRVGSPIPKGVILVEELNNSKEVGVSHEEEGEEEEEDKWNDTKVMNNQFTLHSATKTWGVLIQAKGHNHTACYLLRTCRVQTFFGACTHFSLVRAKCFVENAETQLKKMWLQT